MSDAESLRETLRALDQEMHDRWQRSLPFDELLSDRWERAQRLGFGDGASIYASSYVYGKVKVGARTWIGPFTILDGSGGLEIGENCSISSGVQIYTHDTVRWALSGGEFEPDRAPVVIGGNCYIGAQSVIAKGVRIGDRCVVGACSFVNTDVADGTIVAGTPARLIGLVDELGHAGRPGGDSSR